MPARDDLIKELQEVQRELEELAATIPLDVAPPKGVDMGRYEELKEKRNTLHELVKNIDSKE